MVYNPQLLTEFEKTGLTYKSFNEVNGSGMTQIKRCYGVYNDIFESNGKTYKLQNTGNAVRSDTLWKAFNSVTYNEDHLRGGSDNARYRKTAYQVQEAFQIRNNTLIDIIETIGLSYNAWEINQKQSRALKTYVYNVGKTNGAYFEQYKIGKRTLLDLLNVENEKYNAEIDYLKAQRDEVYARYRILNGMGKLLPYFSSKNICN